MKTTKNALLLLVALSVACSMWFFNAQVSDKIEERILQATTYTTSSTRLSLVEKACAGKNRSNMISQGSQAQKETYKAQLSAQFKLNSTNLFKKIIDQDYAALQPMFTSDVTPYVLFIGPYIVGLILIILIWPFLCCCCCCTGCCPSKCCQKAEDQQYTKCQLLWPGVVLIIALLLSCVASIVGFTRANGLANGLTNSACSTFILVDDFLNGNVTQDGSSFFAGLNTAISQLAKLNTSINSIKTQMQKLQPTSAFMTGIFTRLSTAKSQVSKIPSGVAGGSLTLSYNTPINSNGASVPYASDYIAILGNQGSASSNVGVTYTVLGAFETFMNTLASAATGFTGSVGTFTSSLSGVTGQIGDLTAPIDNITSSMTTYYEYVQPALDGLTIGVSVYFGIVIGFTILAVIGCLLMSFCDKFKCRYLIYFACIILFFIGFIGFLLAVIFSILTPVLHFGCQFLDFTLASQPNFYSVFNSLIDAKTTVMITTCFPGGTGDIISILAPNVAPTLDSALSAVSSVSAFNGTAQASIIDTPFNTMGTMLSDYRNNIKIDLDTANVNILKRLADKNNFAACNQALFQADSWVPSTNAAQITVPCQVGTTSTNCATGANFNAGSGGCTGCLSTYDLLKTNTTRANVFSAINTRYSTAPCTGTTFAAQLADTWNNFYKVKQTALSAVQTRYTTAGNAITAVKNDLITNIPNTFLTISAQLNSAAASVIDPKYGLIAGLNCLLIGEDVVRLTKVICTQAFNNIFFMMLICGIASFGILFSMCCAVCAGVRHYKHSERIGKLAIADAFDEGSAMKLNSNLYNNKH